MDSTKKEEMSKEEASNNDSDKKEKGEEQMEGINTLPPPPPPKTFVVKLIDPKRTEVVKFQKLLRTEHVSWAITNGVSAVFQTKSGGDPDEVLAQFGMELSISVKEYVVDFEKYKEFELNEIRKEADKLNREVNFINKH